MELAERLEDTVREAQQRVKPQVDEATKRVVDLNKQAIDYIKENPGKCLLGALAVGFIIGKLARR